MTPLRVQQQALDALEKLGGKPVVLQEDPSCPNPAKIRIATTAEPVHVLTYHAAAVNELPYLVCFQCKFAERALRSAPDERFNVASTRETYACVEKLVVEKGSVPRNMLATYSQMITDGLGTQLRSMPIGIHVDRELYHSHPELHTMQKAIVMRQLQDNLGALHPSVRELAPDLFVNASLGMNAAVALAWARLWGVDEHAVPYRLAGFAERGEELLKSLDATPDSPTHDRELVRTWARIVGVGDLYRIGPDGL